MLEERKEVLIDILRDGGCYTAQELADRLGCSNRTARSSVHELSSELSLHGARIESKARKGYCLVIDDLSAFDSYIAFCRRPSPVPSGGRDRVDYLLCGLLFAHSHVKSSDVCSILYVSNTTLSACIKEVEGILAPYGLSIERKPGYGMRIEGDESDVRKLLSARFLAHQLYPMEFGEDVAYQIERTAQVVKGLCTKHGISLSEFAFESFVDYAYVSLVRMNAGFSIDLGDGEFPCPADEVRNFISEFFDILEVRDYVADVEDEVRSLELYLGALRSSADASASMGVVIREQSDRLAMEILELLSRDYGVDFCRNLDLRLSLAQHLAPLDVRMRFDIPASNPLLDEVKGSYRFAFIMAQTAASVLEHHYGRPVPESETGFIALILQLGIERMRSVRRRRILIVCSTGKSSSRLLRYRFEHEFAEYLENIEICDQFELPTFDLRDIDYVITTIPLTQPLPKPVLEIGPLLGDGDMLRVSRFLRNEPSQSISERYIGPARFVRAQVGGMFGDTKEEILAALCLYISAREDVSDDFYDLVLEREALIQVDVGAGVALPHPNAIASESTFCYVMVLSEPIRWNDDDVDLVFLASMGSSDASEDRHLLSEGIANLVLNPNALRQLREDPTYECLAGLLDA